MDGSADGVINADEVLELNALVIAAEVIDQAVEVAVMLTCGDALVEDETAAELTGFIVVELELGLRLLLGLGGIEDSKDSFLAFHTSGM